MRSLRPCIFLFIVFFQSHVFAAAGDLSQTFTLEGQLYDSPMGTDPLLDQVDITVKILSHNSLCVLYAEKQTVDLTTTDGVFNIEIGSTVVDPGIPITLEFSGS